ncbi:hypothetical protein [Nodosilinea sp. E11]|uniref:hypothetical protein n=1 Tax=Nodosilinea sp. E11 TaxID=3037479 RepID=UPI0029352403|nr:hypothetical protein [Nodosilinea sp. E11]WOD38164.1 hypothetical protein RRF56_18290 [Nodosilinea sp. E11]
MKRPFRSLSVPVSVAALIGAVGLMVGCTNTAPATQTVLDQAGLKESAHSLDQLGLQQNMPYKDARDRLLRQGWEPRTDGDAPNLSDATVRELVNLGYPEVKDCAGTGLGPCRFEFVNEAGDVFVVSTIQNGSGTNRERFVLSWGLDEAIAQSTDAAPPFFGERYFNFYGGNSTEQSIIIELDGSTTIRAHGTVSSSVLYRGPFSNPILTSEGDWLQIDGDRISIVSASGQVMQGCNGENELCESALYEATPSALIPDGYYVMGGTAQGLEVAGDRYRYYDEMGHYDWHPLSDLTLSQDNVIFDGEHYWCMLPDVEAGVCTEAGWRSLSESLSE